MEQRLVVSKKYLASSKNYGMKNEIVEGNRAIAEFIGKRIGMAHIDDYKERKLPVYFSSRLRYHKSWDAIMPVVSKCYSLCNENQRPDEEIKLSEALLSCDINEVFAAVVQFIQLHIKKK